MNQKRDRRGRYEGLKVRLDPHSGEVNLRVSYGTLREVFTAAALHCYHSLEERKKKGGRRESNDYDKGLLSFVHGIESLLEDQRVSNKPAGPLTVRQRREAVLRSKQERELFEGMLSALRAERAKR